MEIIVTTIKQIGREFVLADTSVIGYQHSANLYVRLLMEEGKDHPFAGMVLSAYCKHRDSDRVISCPLEEREDGIYILLNHQIFEQSGDVYLSIGGINEHKVVVTSNLLALHVDESNCIISSTTPAEKYWQIEVLNAMRIWYANTVEPMFQESKEKFNQLIQQTEEHEAKAKDLQAKAEQQQEQVDALLSEVNTAIQHAEDATTQANDATQAAATAADHANTAAAQANDSAQAANTAKTNAETATTNANEAAQAANDLVKEIEQKLIAGELSKDTPIGVIHEYAGESAPAGYLLCDGQAVSRDEYANLYAVIGERYGAGDGANTFHLPDLRGRVAVGCRMDDTDFDTLGKQGGSKTHTLTSDEMPSHTHVQDAHKHSAAGSSNEAGAHTHGASSNSTGAHTHTTSGTAASNGEHAHSRKWGSNGPTTSDGDSIMTGWAGTNTNNAWSNRGIGQAGSHTHSVSGTAASAGGHSHTVTVTSAGSHSHAVSVTVNNAMAVNQPTGGGLAHNNMQPYLVLNYIIKY